MYELIDTHTHVYSEEFDHDVDDMLCRASDVGVRAMVLPNVDVASYPRMMSLVKRYPDRLYPCLGLHPTSVGADYAEQLQSLESQLGSYPFVAIGEIGLDYYWDMTFVNEQLRAFEYQLQLAQKLGLPVVIHTRSAWQDTIATLERVATRSVRGVFHAFTGEAAELDEALAFPNMYIGIGGVVTFKNSSLREHVGRIPLDRLLLETDAPYLSPVPRRGRRNEPAHLVYTLEYLAPIYGLSAEELARQTSLNAHKLFGLNH